MAEIIFSQSGTSTVITSTTGVAGPSAYDIWLELGNTGTKQQFIDSLKATGGGGGTGDLTKAQADTFYVSASDTRLTNPRTPLDLSVTNAKVANAANISLDKTADTANKVAMTPAERTKLTGIAAGASANSPDATLVNRANHTGTQPIASIVNLQTSLDDKVSNSDGRLSDARIPAEGSVTNVRVATNANISLDKTADSATRLAFLPAERTKLTGVATGATANAADATLLARANHTGTQAISTVSGLQTALDAKANAGSTLTTEQTAKVANAGVFMYYNATTGWPARPATTAPVHWWSVGNAGAPDPCASGGPGNTTIDIWWERI